MRKQIIRTDRAPSSPLYAQAVKVGSTLYVSGTTGMDPATKQMAGPTVREQTRQALRNCATILDAAGASLADVVQVTVLLANPADFTDMNQEYARVFATEPPARSVGKLGVELPNLLVSLVMIAEIP